MSNAESKIASGQNSTATACVPYAPADCSLHESCFELLCQVYDFFEHNMRPPHIDAPLHSHSVKGIRDEDGLPCQWCATWEKVRKMCTENTGADRRPTGKTTKDQT